MRSETLSSLQANESAILEEWLGDLGAAGWGRDGRFSEADMRDRAQEFLRLVTTGAGVDANSPGSAGMRGFLESLSSTLAARGATSAQTATFVFSLKKPVFKELRRLHTDAKTLGDETWAASEMFDELGLFTATTFQKSREDIIRRQQEELLELSTPVVKLWEGVLALPMIGTLDSARTHVVMESLLQRIVETGSATAIIDITGVPTVDTLVAQHLLKTVTAIRLMGADCIISGIRPQIAQTIVHLGIDLTGITTKATLADALLLALKREGYAISKKGA
jgi:rsbT co-antagonist protein RsbR